MERRFFIKSLVVGTGVFIIKEYRANSAEKGRDDIVAKMIYNNTGDHPDFKKEWGLALWIEKSNLAVLFDTGGNPVTLWNNMQKAGIDLSRLEAIIISHNHWDHTRGLPMVLEKTAYKPVVYVPFSDSDDIKQKIEKASIIPIQNPSRILDFLWTTGEMKGEAGDQVIYEQSLLIIKDNQVFLFTGCAHPGIVNIVEKAKEMQPDKEIALVAGGFHLMNMSIEQIEHISAKLTELNVKRLAPSHCTGDKAIEYFRNTWKDKFVDLNIGDSYII
jgi:7,8-dihydropterin-6-yl-methyl-4-(beta-D-ribofuranosyl)aminobenzene 5'-phosphate synthase